KRLQKIIQAKIYITIALAMHYGKPFIQIGLAELHQKGVSDVFVMPLYPLYPMATTLTITELATTIQKKLFKEMKFTHFPAFYNRKEYVKALSESIKKHL